MGTGIDFSRSNKALIYAPNGVMKTSFTKVFEDLSKGEAPKDRIFSAAQTAFSITYYASNYTYTSANPKNIPSCDAVYVVNSFDDHFEFTKETVSTLLADEATRNEYNAVMANFMERIKVFEAELASKSGLTKPKVKDTLIADLQLPRTADWPDIVNKLHEILQEGTPIDYLGGIKYTVLLHDKAIAVYEKSEFKQYIQQYIERLGELLRDSEVLNSSFTDRSAETLTKTFATNNLFSAEHKIVLKDGTEIRTLDEWKRVVDHQINLMYADENLHSAFEKLKKLLTANNDVDAARQIIVEYQQIIPLLFEIPTTKKRMWVSYCSQMETPFEDYYSEVSVYAERVRDLYEKAAGQSERWQQVIEEFNRRFRVPFTVQINNKSNFILKDEAPNLTFVYKRVAGGTAETQDMTKDTLLPSLSMGEKRAMYILYILFDLERIRIQAAAGQKHLIITDDIADSFDYKNKYAIIEYLADLSQNTGIDLLMLTHNFDFFRTVKSRLDVKRNNSYIAQRDDTGKIKMSVFRYQKDFFKNVILAGINGNNQQEQKRMLIASIPFYRNLAEYCGEDHGENNDYLKLTCFLHYKTTPINTETATLSDLWSIIQPYVNGTAVSFGTESYYDTVQSFATDSLITPDDISLENKLIISIAARLRAEKYLKQVIIANEGSCDDSGSNQMRDWYDKAKGYLTAGERTVMDDINLITPETIHLNAFMYEPLIDVSIWALNDIYTRAVELC
ncbi:AAA family ATPase [Bacteroides sp.]|uniref:AAA family ATPase n=1 Tax=Bacteroides sp. TaxID=29523 RepID=UPI0026363721|nr:AAA family ATPase [Bacteroides sp.]MDD3041189.1 AAA family ATPase [Bacteroides sp.]